MAPLQAQANLHTQREKTLKIFSILLIITTVVLAILVSLNCYHILPLHGPALHGSLGVIASLFLSSCIVRMVHYKFRPADRTPLPLAQRLLSQDHRNVIHALRPHVLRPDVDAATGPVLHNPTNPTGIAHHEPRPDVSIEILKEKGFSYPQRGGCLIVHPQLIEKDPKYILDNWCKLTQKPSRVRFYKPDDTFSQQAGSDAGGLSRQFYATLCRKLLDSSCPSFTLSKGCLLIKEGSDDAKHQQIQDLQNLAALFDFMLGSNLRLITGRFFENTFFEILKRIHDHHQNHSTKSLDSLHQYVCENCLSNEAQSIRLWATHDTKLDSSKIDNAKEILEYLAYDPTYEGAKLYLQETISSFIEGASQIYQHCPKLRELYNRNLSISIISSTLQGEPIGLQDLLNCFFNDNHRVTSGFTRLKEWLLEKIRLKWNGGTEEGRAWVSKFIQAITGSPNLTSGTRIALVWQVAPALHWSGKAPLGPTPVRNLLISQVHLL